MTANADNNVTTFDILDTIGSIFDGDVMDFLASFIDYCNDRTFFGVPRKCAPLDGGIVPQFDTITLQVSDAAIDYDYCVECAYELKQLIDSTSEYDVYVTPYIYDAEYEEVSISTSYIPKFDVSHPADLKKLCYYVGVTFQPDYFSE